MKRHVLLALVAVLAVLSTTVLRNQCNAITVSADARADSTLTPILTRLGEEYFIRVDGAKWSPRASEQNSPPRATAVNRALQLHLTQRLLQKEADELGNVSPDSSVAERKRRGDEPPISLDLTFHLLREVLEMARAEQLAQQASSNRKLMDFFGK